MNRILSEVVLKKDIEKISIVLGMTGKLKTAFKEVSEKEPSGAVMKNTDKVYAGLTYSKGKLNEYKVR
jgi:flagellar protein FliS